MSARGIILIAEDNQKLRTVYFDFLTATGYSVLSAPDGIQALSLLSTVRPELILLDVTMPKLNGIETCKRARRMVGDYVPIIFLTALERLDILRACFAAGGDDYLIKSQSLESIHARVKYWMSLSRDPIIIKRRADILAKVTAAATSQSNLAPHPFEHRGPAQSNACQENFSRHPGRAGRPKD